MSPAGHRTASPEASHVPPVAARVRSRRWPAWWLRRLGEAAFPLRRLLRAADNRRGRLERIRGLAIPPAWTDVWISPNAGAKLQATGEDAAGRRQYLYHERFRVAQEREKFERLLPLRARLPTLRSRLAKDLRLGPYEEEWACAPRCGS